MYELRRRAGLCSPFGCWLFMLPYRLFARYAANRTGDLLCVSDKRVSLGCGICRVTASGTSRPVCALVGLFQCCGFFRLAICARTSIAPALGAGRRSRERSWRGKKECTAPNCKKAEEDPPRGGGHTFTPLGHCRRKEPICRSPARGGVHTFTPFRRYQGKPNGGGVWDSQGQEPQGSTPCAAVARPRHVTLCFEANLFCRKETPADILKKFPCFLKQIHFARMKIQRISKKAFSLCLEANPFHTNENQMFPLPNRGLSFPKRLVKTCKIKVLVIC